MATVKRGKRKTDKTAIDLNGKRAEAVRLRIEGKTFEEIAKRLGYKTPSAVYKLVEQALREVVREPAGEYLALMSRRYEAMYAAVTAKALKGNLGSVMVATSVLDKLCRLHGLNAPTKVEGKVDVTGGFDVSNLTPEQKSQLGELILAARGR